MSHHSGKRYFVYDRFFTSHYVDYKNNPIEKNGLYAEQIRGDEEYSRDGVLLYKRPPGLREAETKIVKMKKQEHKPGFIYHHVPVNYLTVHETTCAPNNVPNNGPLQQIYSGRKLTDILKKNKIGHLN